MVKDEYLRYREDPILSILPIYEYYLDVKENSPTMNLEDFTVAWNLFIVQFNGQRIQTHTGIRFIQIDLIREKIYKYFDEKFGI